MNAFQMRIKDRARSNQLAIAVGDAFAGTCSLTHLYRAINTKLDLEGSVETEQNVFSSWNGLVHEWESRGADDAVESKGARIKENRELLLEVIETAAQESPIGEVHQLLAAIPISNYIDTTWSQKTVAALRETGRRQPYVHGFWDNRIGGWTQGTAEIPNVFLTFAQLGTRHPWNGLREILTPQNGYRIGLENLMEMVRHKYLLLLDFSSAEAEFILHLPALSQSADKVFNTNDPTEDYRYWAKTGTHILDVRAQDFLRALLPVQPDGYSAWDGWLPNLALIDVARDRQFDCFLSYSSKDKAFVDELERGLRNNDIRVWRDIDGMRIGDGIEQRLNAVLRDCYTMIVVLSPAALASKWVQRELREAEDLSRDGKLRILPALWRDCDVPAFLTETHRADFRVQSSFADQLPELVREVRLAIREARGKA